LDVDFGGPWEPCVRWGGSDLPAGCDITGRTYLACLAHGQYSQCCLSVGNSDAACGNQSTVGICLILDSVSSTIENTERSSDFDAETMSLDSVTDQPDSTDEDLASGLRQRMVSENLPTAF